MTTPHDAEARAMRCLDCGYDLRGLAVHRCPECGRAFAPADARTILQRPVDGRRLLAWMALSLVCAIAPFIAIVVLRPERMQGWMLSLVWICNMGSFALLWSTTGAALRVIRGRDPWAVHPWAVRAVAVIGCLFITGVLLCAFGALIHGWFLN